MTWQPRAIASSGGSPRPSSNDRLMKMLARFIARSTPSLVIPVRSVSDHPGGSCRGSSSMRNPVSTSRLRFMMSTSRLRGPAEAARASATRWSSCRRTTLRASPGYAAAAWLCDRSDTETTPANREASSADMAKRSALYPPWLKMPTRAQHCLRRGRRA